MPLGRELKGQIYLGATHLSRSTQLSIRILKIPLAELRAGQAVAGADICKSGNRAIAEAYNHGYRLHEIAALLSVHYGTVSSRLKQIEQTK